MCFAHYQRKRNGVAMDKPILFQGDVANRNTPLHNSWSNMKARCDNPNKDFYERYGGRGIRYCESWAIFKNFEADMLPTWRPGLTLERVDSEGHYEPGNCRWATRKEQTANRAEPANQKLNFEIAQDIRRQYESGKYTQAALARHYGVTQALISQVVRGKQWNG
jgi:hypothetical protein